jgi:hypothetical protein
MKEVQASGKKARRMHKMPHLIGQLLKNLNTFSPKTTNVIILKKGRTL